MNTPQAQPQDGIPTAPEAFGLGLRLDAILTPLLRLINRYAPTFGALFLPLHARLVRTHQRLARLLARLATGTYPAPRAKRPNQPSGPREIYIPHRHAWLVVKLGHHAAGYGSQLNHLLSEPETQALLAAAPPHAQAAAARTLRPLCRLLGIPLPPLLQTPPAPKKPKPKKPKPEKPPRPPRLTARDLYPWRTPRPMPFLPPAKKKRPA